MLSAIVRPVVERHLQDAAFYWSQLDGCLRDPGLRAERALHFAQLLAAHVEGILVAQDAAIPWALESFERWRKPGEAFAAAYAAISAEDTAAVTKVLQQVSRAPDVLLRGLISALMMAPEAAKTRFLEAAGTLVGSEVPSDRCHLAAALRGYALSALPVEGGSLRAALRHPHPSIRAAACRAGGGHSDIAHLMDDVDIAVRAEAAISLGGATRGGSVGILWQAALEQARRSEVATGWNQQQAQRRLTRWLRHLAWLTPSGYAELPALLARLPRREALYFVLFRGDPAFLGMVLDDMEDAQLSRWAGFVWQGMTGCDLQEAGLALPEPPIDLEEAMTPSHRDRDLGLAVPDAAALRRHPINLAMASHRGQRLLLGRSLSAQYLAELLCIESNHLQLLRAVAAQAWNEQRCGPRINLRACSSALLGQDRMVSALI